MKLTSLALLLLAAALLCTACAAPEASATTPEITTQTEDFDYHYNLGLKYLSEGNYQEAILAFTAAIDIDPKRAEAYVMLADGYIGLGQPLQAEAALRQGIETAGEDATLKDKLEALAVSDAYYQTLDESARQVLARLEAALRASDHATARGIQQSPELQAIYQAVPGEVNFWYYPDSQTTVHVFGQAGKNYQMALWQGQEGSGSYALSKYGSGTYGDAGDGYTLSITSYSGGRANGPFTVYRYTGSARGNQLYMDEGVLSGGAATGTVYRTADGETAEHEYEPDWYDWWPSWPARPEGY